VKGAKAWTRSRVPSITLTSTRTVSPGAKSGILPAAFAFSSSLACIASPGSGSESFARIPGAAGCRVVPVEIS